MNNAEAPAKKEPAILHLTLHRKWFDLINSGEKKIEYRDRSDYWDRRLRDKEYDLIRFVNGYGRDRPYMIARYEGCRLGTWEGRPAFEILIGEILVRGNI